MVSKVVGSDGGGTCELTCNTCREVAILDGEVADIRQMMECLKRRATGQCMHASMYVQSVCMYVSMYICMYVCMYVCHCMYV